jgi:hypothetical protein
LEELASQRVVLTQFVPNVNFASYQTFAMTDSIPVVVENVGGDGGSSATKTIDPATSAPLLDAIAIEMTRRGYRRVAPTEQPDLGVAVTGVVRQNAFVSYGAWWGFGATTAGAFGTAGVPLASGGISGGIALWESGALVIEFFDVRAARQALGAVPIAAPPPLDAGHLNASLGVVWAAFIYGVVQDLDRTGAQPIALVQQAFTQSPYLGTQQTQQTTGIP